MYSGKTVMINNTDAEGRLVLADSVAFAAKVRFESYEVMKKCVAINSTLFF